MKPNFVLEFREAPHGLLRIQKCSAGVDQPCVRYPVREENREITDGIIRLDNQHHEPVCEMGALKIYVHAYVDRVEIRFVTEKTNPQP